MFGIYILKNNIPNNDRSRLVHCVVVVCLSLESLTQLLLVMKLSRLVSYSAGLVVVADSLAW